MNVLLCSTGINSLGETFTLALFGKELMSFGHHCYFIAPKLGKDYLLTFGFTEDQILVLPNDKKTNNAFDCDANKNILQQFAKKISPKYIIVADWHHYKEDGHSNNNTYSIHWFDKDIPMGTFDHVGFAPEGKIVKQDEIAQAIESKAKRDFQEKEFPPMHDRFSFIIRPCPHHDNRKQFDKNIFYWGIYKDKLERREDDITQIRNKYGLNENSKLIFHAIGLWQERVIDKLFEELNIEYDYYDETFFPILLNYLSKVDENFTYICLSGKTKVEKVINIKNIKFVKIPPLKHKEFMQHLLACDLFLTDNLMSSNLGKAVFSNIPSVVFKNSITPVNGKINPPFKISNFINDKIKTLIDNDLFFPYRSFPIGLCELEEMYINNGFANCFVETEFFDEERNIELFRDLFSNTASFQKIFENQDNYIYNNKKLFSSEEILNHI